MKEVFPGALLQEVVHMSHRLVPVVHTSNHLVFLWVALLVKVSAPVFTCSLDALDRRKTQVCILGTLEEHRQVFAH